MASKQKPARGARRPLVFISHDTRDQELARAFENLLVDASGGTIDVFRSSDRTGRSGIEYGDEWYPATMQKLAEASEVVAILTSSSLDRPWILYEIGVARGLRHPPIIGVAFGLSPGRLEGPLQQLHTCGDDEESLTGVVLQIIRKNTNAVPREDSVRRQVASFRQQLPAMLAGDAPAAATELIALPAYRGLHNRESLTPIEQLAAGATEILASGVTLVHLIGPRHDYFRKKLTEGVTLRFVVLDRETDAWRAWHEGQNIQTPEDIDITLRTLAPLFDRTDPGRIEVRFSRFTLPVSLVIADPGGEGRMNVEFAFTGFSVHDRPHIYLTRHGSPEWFDFFVERFEYLWSLSKPWQPPENLRRRARA